MAREEEEAAELARQEAWRKAHEDEGAAEQAREEEAADELVRQEEEADDELLRLEEEAARAQALEFESRAMEDSHERLILESDGSLESFAKLPTEATEEEQRQAAQDAEGDAFRLSLLQLEEELRLEGEAAQADIDRLQALADQRSAEAVERQRAFDAAFEADQARKAQEEAARMEEDRIAAERAEEAERIKREQEALYEAA